MFRVQRRYWVNYLDATCKIDIVPWSLKCSQFCKIAQNNLHKTARIAVVYLHRQCLLTTQADIVYMTMTRGCCDTCQLDTVHIQNPLHNNQVRKSDMH